MARFQYQARAEPLRDVATTTVDRWFNQTSQPTRRAASIVLLVAGLFAPVAPAVPVTPDQWQPCLNQPPKTYQPRMAGVQVVDPLLVPNPPTVSHWQPELNQPPKTYQPRMAGLCVTDPLLVPNPPTVAHWQPELNQPPRTFAPRQSGTALVDPKQPNAIRIEGWEYVLTMPRAAQRRQAGGVIRVDVVTVAPTSGKAAAIYYRLLLDNSI